MAYAKNAQLIFTFQCSTTPDEDQWYRILTTFDSKWAGGKSRIEARQMSLQKASVITDDMVKTELNDYIHEGLVAAARSDMSVGGSYDLKPFDTSTWHIGSGGQHEGSRQLALQDGMTVVEWWFDVSIPSGSIRVYPFVTGRHFDAKVITVS